MPERMINYNQCFEKYHSLINMDVSKWSESLCKTAKELLSDSKKDSFSSELKYFCKNHDNTKFLTDSAVKIEIAAIDVSAEITHTDLFYKHHRREYGKLKFPKFQEFEECLKNKSINTSDWNIIKQFINWKLKLEAIKFNYNKDKIEDCEFKIRLKVSQPNFFRNGNFYDPNYFFSKIKGYINKTVLEEIKKNIKCAPSADLDEIGEDFDVGEIFGDTILCHQFSQPLNSWDSFCAILDHCPFGEEKNTNEEKDKNKFIALYLFREKLFFGVDYGRIINEIVDKIEPDFIDIRRITLGKINEAGSKYNNHNNSDLIDKYIDGSYRALLKRKKLILLFGLLRYLKNIYKKPEKLILSRIGEARYHLIFKAKSYSEVEIKAITKWDDLNEVLTTCTQIIFDYKIVKGVIDFKSLLALKGDK